MSQLNRPTNQGLTPVTSHQSLLHPQIAAGHLLWHGKAENAEKRRRDIAERTAGCERRDAVLCRDDQRNWIRRVISVRPAGHGIDHRFGVAVVGSHNPRPAVWL